MFEDEPFELSVANPFVLVDISMVEVWFTNFFG